jgi:hypothetical protein
MTDPVGLARFLLRSLVDDPEGATVEHVWTPEIDFVFLKLRGPAKKKLREEDLAALVRLVERLARGGDRQVVVDTR